MKEPFDIPISLEIVRLKRNSVNASFPANKRTTEFWWSDTSGFTMEIEALKNYPALRSFLNNLPLKSLQWIDESESNFSSFRAASDFGCYHYGVDTDKVAWAATPERGDISFESVETARQYAEKHHKMLSVSRFLSVLEPSRLPGLEALVAEVQSIQAMFKKYADDCNDSRFWNGPTIFPPNPVNENNARNNGKTLAEFLGLQPQ